MHYNIYIETRISWITFCTLRFWKMKKLESKKGRKLRKGLKMDIVIWRRLEFGILIWKWRIFWWLVEFQKLSILGWSGKHLEEVDSAKWDTPEEEANFENITLFVSLFRKLNFYFLVAGTPGFADQRQFTDGFGYGVCNIFYFLFCKWNTAWTLLYKPINEEERKTIDEIVKVKKWLKREWATLSHGDIS